jgi:hypothetical protein
MQTLRKVASYFLNTGQPTISLHIYMIKKEDNPKRLMAGY